MMGVPERLRTTPSGLVLPFYAYAAASFLASALLAFFSLDAFGEHHHHPHLLAVTHSMALGWATMIIFGASYQLVPVLIERELYSVRMGYVSFAFLATGIPLLVGAFYAFDMGPLAKWGGRLVLLGFALYLINLSKSIALSGVRNIHVRFVHTAAIWLFVVGAFGLVLVYNFTFRMLPGDPWKYLPLHAHAGVLGWFLMLILGIASRLIPMFLVSKYTNERLLVWIYYLVNSALAIYIVAFYVPALRLMAPLLWVLLLAAVILFGAYCRGAFLMRLRKSVDAPMKMSLLSVLMILLPLVAMLAYLVAYAGRGGAGGQLLTTYGYLIFFGWITAIILGMTFKTLPFIVWNREYRPGSFTGKPPNPKDLYSDGLFKAGALAYLVGFAAFASGIAIEHPWTMRVGAGLVVVAAVAYNANAWKVLLHRKPAPK
ncbi:MAG: hypothetical protein KBF37_03360 [Saprospiraceae bacterium]|jgi:hypothetical protein|nr:hypothetical protein [Saprospiraceae bacterium]MBP9209339.1 hypothetical protein [Saprospiraceae bacterium]